MTLKLGDRAPDFEVETTEGPAVGVEQGVEQRAATTIGQRLEHGFVRSLVRSVVDGAIIGDYLVT